MSTSTRRDRGSAAVVIAAPLPSSTRYLLVRRCQHAGSGSSTVTGRANPSSTMNRNRLPRAFLSMRMVSSSSATHRAGSASAGRARRESPRAGRRSRHRDAAAPGPARLRTPARPTTAAPWRHRYSLGPLDRMPEGVAVVEDLAQALSRSGRATTTSALTRTERSTSSCSTGLPGRAAAPDRPRSARGCRVGDEPALDHLGQPGPVVRAAAGWRSSVRSQSTPAGGWNAPTRFLPRSVLMPVLPPTAASTMPASVVGSCTTRTPRSQAAATQPARSVVAPPPSPDDGVGAGEAELRRAGPSSRRPPRASWPPRRPAPRISAVWYPAATSSVRTALRDPVSTSAGARRRRGWRRPATAPAHRRRRCRSAPSYGRGPPTLIRVASLMRAHSRRGRLLVQPGRDLRGHLSRRAARRCPR